MADHPATQWKSAVSSRPDEDELEARCLIAFSVAIASHLIAADHRGRSREDVRALIARRLFAR